MSLELPCRPRHPVYLHRVLSRCRARRCSKRWTSTCTTTVTCQAGRARKGHLTKALTVGVFFTCFLFPPRRLNPSFGTRATRDRRSNPSTGGVTWDSFRSDRYEIFTCRRVESYEVSKRGYIGTRVKLSSLHTERAYLSDTSYRVVALHEQRLNSSWNLLSPEVASRSGVARFHREAFDCLQKLHCSDLHDSYSYLQRLI